MSKGILFCEAWYGIKHRTLERNIKVACWWNQDRKRRRALDRKLCHPGRCSLFWNGTGHFSGSDQTRSILTRRERWKWATGRKTYYCPNLDLASWVFACHCAAKITTASKILLPRRLILCRILFYQYMYTLNEFFIPPCHFYEILHNFITGILCFCFYRKSKTGRSYYRENYPYMLTGEHY